MASGDPYAGPIYIATRTIPPWDAGGPYTDEDEATACCGITLTCEGEDQSIEIPYRWSFRIETVTPPGAGGNNSGDTVNTYTLDSGQTGLTSGIGSCAERQISTIRNPSGFGSVVYIGGKAYLIFIGYGSSPPDPTKPFFFLIDGQSPGCGGAVLASVANAPWQDGGPGAGVCFLWFSETEFNAGILYATKAMNVQLSTNMVCGTTAQTHDIWIDPGVT